MRVIAGRFGGRRLLPAPAGVRPSTDRVRERLFAVLEPRLPGAYVVDLFCGTGSLGIEALSRGAAGALFVDHAAASLGVLRRNLVALRESAPELDIAVMRSDVRHFIERRWPRRRVNGILMDPPYDDASGPAALMALAEQRGADLDWVAVEHADRELGAPPGLEIERVLRCGDTRVTLLRGGGRP